MGNSTWYSYCCLCYKTQVFMSAHGRVMEDLQQHALEDYDYDSKKNL